jgi:hypothetical protein
MKLLSKQSKKKIFFFQDSDDDDDAGGGDRSQSASPAPRTARSSSPEVKKRSLSPDQFKTEEEKQMELVRLRLLPEKCQHQSV